jgi:hypothetical protein
LKIQFSNSAYTNFSRGIITLIKLVKFTKDISIDKYFVTSSELNEMFLNKYSKLPIFNRLEEMAERLSERMCNGKLTKKATFYKKIISIGGSEDDSTIIKTKRALNVLVNKVQQGA